MTTILSEEIQGSFHSLDEEILQSLFFEVEIVLDTASRKMNSAEHGAADWARVRIDIAVKKAEIEQELKNRRK